MLKVNKYAIRALKTALLLTLYGQRAKYINLYAKVSFTGTQKDKTYPKGTILFLLEV